MANYLSAERSNLFRVTDENAYEKLIKGLTGEDIYVQTEKDKDGNIRHFIGSYNGISWYPPASKNKELKEFMENNKVFDGSKEVHQDDIDDYDYLYDINGNQVYDRYNGDDDFDEFLNELQTLLPDDEAFIFTEAGHEKLRSVDGWVTIVTNKTKCFMSTHEFIRNTIEELFGKNNNIKY